MTKCKIEKKKYLMLDRGWGIWTPAYCPFSRPSSCTTHCPLLVVDEAVVRLQCGKGVIISLDTTAKDGDRP